MPGRKAKPTAIKIAENNPGKRPLNANEPQPRKVRPKIPAHLGPAARVEWMRVMRIMQPMGVITEAEADLLAVYCSAYARWVQCNGEIQRLGLIMLNEKGSPMRNPLLKVADDAVKVMLRCQAELGLSPSSRARLSVGTQVGDALDKFLLDF